MRKLLIVAAGLAAVLVAGPVAIAAASTAGAAEGAYKPTRIDRYDASGMPLASRPINRAAPQRAGGAAPHAPVRLAASRPPRHQRHGHRYRRPPRPYYRPPPRAYRPYYAPPLAYVPPLAYIPPIYAPPVYRRGPRCVTRVVRNTPRGRVVRVVRGCGPRARPYRHGYRGRPYRRGY